VPYRKEDSYLCPT